MFPCISISEVESEVVCLDFSLLSLSINLEEICQCRFSFGLDLNYAEEHIILCRIGP